MKNLAPAARGGQRLNLNLGGTDHSITQNKAKCFNHLKTLKDISDKWVDKGCYSSSGRALRALIGGELCMLEAISNSLVIQLIHRVLANWQVCRSKSGNF